MDQSMQNPIFRLTCQKSKEINRIVFIHIMNNYYL